MTGRLKDNGFALTALQGGLRGGIRALLWAKNGPKIRFFYATPIKSLFLGSDEHELMRS